MDRWFETQEDAPQSFKNGQLIELKIYKADKATTACNGLFKVLWTKTWPYVSAECLGCSDSEYSEYYTKAGEDGCAAEDYYLHFCEGKAADCTDEPEEEGDEYLHVDTYCVVSNRMAKDQLTSWEVDFPEASVFALATKANSQMGMVNPKSAGPAAAAAAPKVERPKAKAKKKALLASMAKAKAEKQEAAEALAAERDKDRDTWLPGGKLRRIVYREEKVEKKKEGAPALEDVPKRRTADSVLDSELDSLKELVDGAGPEESAEDLEALREQLKRKRNLKENASGKKQKAAADVLAERAKVHAASPKKGILKDEDKPETVHTLEKVLKVMMRKSSDDDSDQEAAGEDMESKKMVYRRLAKTKPGVLLKRLLMNMKDQVQPMSTGDDDEDPLSPVCMMFFMSIFLPNFRDLEEVALREIRTLAEAIDGLLKGKTLEVGDLLAMRLKAAMLAAESGSWVTAKHLELLPPMTRHLPISQDEESLIRRVEAGEIKVRELVDKIKASG